MARDLTSDDRGKSVLTSDGDRVGTVSDVQNGRGHVETDDSGSGLTEKILSALGWDDSDGSHELRNDDIDSVTDNEVRLRNL